MVLTRVDKDIKEILERYNNNPLNNYEFKVLERKRLLLVELRSKGYGKSFKIIFRYKPIMKFVWGFNDYSFDELEYKDYLVKYEFTGVWKKTHIV